jgi:hypothetical protein
MNINIHQIEARLQSLIESLATLFPNKNPLESLVHKLVVCMQANLQFTPDGQTIAPDRYIVTLSPQKMKKFLQKEICTPVLSKALEQVALENGQTFSNPPIFDLKVDENFPPNKLLVECQPDLDDLSDTNSIKIKSDADYEKIVNAYLIVDGNQIHPLTVGVTNIGRRQDNDLIINDPHVSRLHAQIRSSRAQYVIFDLNSSGGTFINGQRVDQRLLKPGDVISLAGVTLIYIEDDSTKEKTEPLKVTRPIKGTYSEKDHS